MAGAVASAGAGRGPRSGANPGRAWLDDAGERLRRAPVELRVALAGTAIVLLAFLVLPYAVGLGTGVTTGGRVWWRPITAVVATVLLWLAMRDQGPVVDEFNDPYPEDVPGGLGSGRMPNPGRSHRLLVTSVVVATVGATEAGLIGLVSGGNPRLRAGYYLMLLGSVVVAAAVTAAALRRAPK